MDIRELKQKIETNKIDNSLLILAGGSSFLHEQYIKRIAEVKNSNIEYVSKLEPNNIFDSDLNIKVYKTDIFKGVDNVNNYKNYIISCESCTTSDAINMPSLEAWQINDYVKAQLPGLSEEEIRWLINILDKDIYRIDMEINRLNLFPEAQQSTELTRLRASDYFTDVSDTNLYDLPNAVGAKDKLKIIKYLNEYKIKGIDPLRVVNLMISQFKSILNVQCTNNATAESLKMSQSKFNVIKNYYVNKYTDKQLVKIFKELNLLDYKLKSGFINEDKLIDYMIVKIFAM